MMKPPWRTTSASSPYDSFFCSHPRLRTVQKYRKTLWWKWR